MYWYYLVLKKTLNLKQDKPDQEYYERSLKQLCLHSVTACTTYEYDPRNIFHCNHVFSTNCRLDYNTMKIKGCHLNFSVINNKKDMFKIMDYIYKDYWLKILPHQLKDETI